MTNSSNAVANREGSPGPRIAGFWRRIVALIIDSAILGTFGFCLGLLWFEQLAAFGSYGRFIGAGIALVYFGVLNSRIARGQTAGKRLLKIRVVDASSNAVSPLRSFPRAFVLLLPFTLNGFNATLSDASPFEIAALTICIFGLGGSIVYLYVFNRRTRQSLHDLAARTFVIDAQTSGEVDEKIWQPHLALLVLWLVALAAGSGPLSAWLGNSGTFKQLLDLQRVVQSAAPEAQVSVLRGYTYGATLAGERSSSEFVQVGVAIPIEPDSYAELADQIADAMFQADPAIRAVERVIISISYGYDIMISTMHSAQTFSLTPQEWEMRLAPRRSTRSTT